MGLTPLILGDALEGEASQMGTVMAGIARSVRGHGQPLRPPAVLLSGGETTVTMSGSGSPPARAAATRRSCWALRSRWTARAGIWATAGDTDGIDGMDEIAGALLTPDTLARARAKGLDARAMLAAMTAMASSARSGT